MVQRPNLRAALRPVTRRWTAYLFRGELQKTVLLLDGSSRPPFLTALALWPKGDGWGGGGLFAKENEIHLNHRAEEMQMAEGFELPRWLNVNPRRNRPGWGEDSPIMDTRLIRDSWRRVQEGRRIEHGIDAPISWEFNPAEVSAKPHPFSGADYELQMHLHGIHQREGPWYVIEHSVVNKTNGSTIALGSTDWADWSPSGDLLFAKQGKLFRLGRAADGSLNALEHARLLIDLTDRTFREVEASSEAKQWDDDLIFRDGSTA